MYRSPQLTNWCLAKRILLHSQYRWAKCWLICNTIQKRRRPCPTCSWCALRMIPSEFLRYSAKTGNPWAISYLALIAWRQVIGLLVYPRFRFFVLHLASAPSAYLELSASRLQLFECVSAPTLFVVISSTHYSQKAFQSLQCVSSSKLHLRFGYCWPLCTFINYIYLITYLLTYWFTLTVSMEHRSASDGQRDRQTGLAYNHVRYAYALHTVILRRSPSYTNWGKVTLTLCWACSWSVCSLQ